MAPTFLADCTAQARAVLGRSRIFDLRCLIVEPDSTGVTSVGGTPTGGVVLRGSVDSYYHKQLAQELLKTAIPGIEVTNRIKVEYRSGPSADHVEWN